MSETPDEFQELREVVANMSSRTVVVRTEQLRELLAAYDRVVRERGNYKISIDELAASMTAKISVLEHKWYPKQDELIRWREFGELVADYCYRMNFEVGGETRGDQIYSTVTDLLKANNG